FNGTFAGEIFTILAANTPVDVGIVLAVRQNTNSNEFWISDSSIILKGKFCWFGNYLIYVDEQINTRCFFSPIIYERTGSFFVAANQKHVFEPKLLGPSDTISETSPLLRTTWLPVLDANAALFPGDFTKLPTYANGRDNVEETDYAIEIGDIVYLATDYKEIHIANLIPSIEVKEVMAFRLVNGVEKLVSVPSRYYTINLSESIAGQTATTIRLNRPLTQYLGEDWKDGLYVSLISTEGPNTADIIEYIVDTYTEYTIDAASFAAVAASLTEYPSDFALLDREDALKVIEDIAWQARCAVFIVNDVIFIKYLAAEESEELTLTESDIDFGTFTLEFSETDELVTVFKALWSDDYSKEEGNQVVLRNNIPKYGKLEQEYDFFIYNIESLVVKSATFWMIRFSNTWKIAVFTTFLQTLQLEILDTVELDFNNQLVASAPIKGVVESADYNSENQKIEYRIWTSVRSGEMSTYGFAWPATADIALVYPTDDDPFAGGA
ncbi:hypothetical protein LCGC14_1579350, partial [marine sediment metagenome]